MYGHVLSILEAEEISILEPSSDRTDEFRADIIYSPTCFGLIEVWINPFTSKDQSNRLM